jgi:regulator of protease activity HflC (stomatin/prohibitin superfamily)
VVIVPQQMAWVVERFGRYDRVLEPGLQLLVPLMHRVRYVFSLKEEALMVPSQTAVTADNVSIGIDGVLYVKVVDAVKAAYGVEDPHFAITQLAQTTMRSEIGKLALDETFLERERLNGRIVEAINAAAADWGIACMRYEIRDIAPPQAVRVAMEMQAEAERRKRALILDSQGEQEAEVNLARGKKAAAVLASEAAMQERINLAKGDASAIEATARASAAAVRMMATALAAEGGHDASALRVAEQYVGAFQALAASGSTVVVPANTGDVGAMVAQAMAIYRRVGAGKPDELARAADGGAEAALSDERSKFGAAGGADAEPLAQADGGASDFPLDERLDERR